MSGGLLLAVTAIVCAAIPAEADPVSIAWIYVIGSVLTLFGAILSRSLGALYLIIAFYFCVFTAIPALVQIQRGQFPFGSSYTDAELNNGFLVVAVGQLFLLVGVAFATRKRGATSAPIRQVRSEDRDSLLARQLAVGSAFVGALLAAVAGPSRIFSTRFDETGSVAELEGLATQLILIARCFTLVALLLSILSLKRSTSDRARHRAVAVLVVTGAVAAIVNFPPALPRFQLLGIGLAIAVLLINFHRPVTKLIFSLGATFFLLYLFATIKNLRDGISFDQLFQRDVGTYLLTADFDSYKQVVDTVIYFSAAPMRFGENFVGALLFWVPRSAWPQKPIHTGEVVSSGIGYPYTNVSNPLPAESFASWGLVGTVLVMLAVGLVVGALERRFAARSSDQRTIPASIAYALFAGYATILMRGALNAVAPMIFSAFVLAGVVFLVYRRTSRQLRPSHTVAASGPRLADSKFSAGVNT